MSDVTYIMVRVEDERDSAVDAVMAALQPDESNVHATFVAAEEISYDDDRFGPVIYWP